ncbi:MULTISPECIES: trypsin-like peptidase domain-containing protein [unclassified Chitinophaga]|uniref:trypsin-like peptidase domain-containing protein n=1 Tax=unclassified Chitinophaga TaxID=2619133 RepID=UPI00300FACE8
MLKVEGYSLAPAKIRMLPPTKDQSCAPVGTCFFYNRENITYLITNGHNLTGRNPETKDHLPGFIYQPTWLSVNLSTISSEKEGGLYKKNYLVPLYKEIDTLNEPMWLIHPEKEYSIDVVAIPFNVPEGVKIFAINEFPQSHKAIEQPGDDVFILGYPILLDETLDLPIWKRGSVATEPGQNLGGMPKFLVDTATRPGMSGSPVILHRKTFDIDKETESITLIQEKFIGIYSGRIGGNDEFQAQLGIVWKSSVIEEIIDGNYKSSTDFMQWKSKK